MAAKSEHPQNLNPAWDDSPAHIPSLTIDLKSAQRPRLDHLSEAQQLVLPATSLYPRRTSGLLVIPGTFVEIYHGRDDGQCRLRMINRHVIYQGDVNLFMKQLFAEASNVRNYSLKVFFRVRDFGAGGNGSNGSAISARRLEDGKQATLKFRRNSIGHAWHAGWDAEAGALEIRVALDRTFLTGCGIVTLRDVVGLRRLSLSALLSPQDICQLPVPWNFSESREALTERLQRMLEGFYF
jgi:hypothetical protein